MKETEISSGALRLADWILDKAKEWKAAEVRLNILVYGRDKLMNIVKNGT